MTDLKYVASKVNTKSNGNILQKVYNISPQYYLESYFGQSAYLYIRKDIEDILKGISF